MAKTKKKSSKKTTQKSATKKSTARKAETEVEVAVASPDTQTSEPPTPKMGARARVEEPRASDPRLPAPGTTIQKRNRAGEVLAECRVLEEGVEFGGVVHRSLSAAAKAAAELLNKKTVAVNGYTWWGLEKPARRGSDPVESLRRAWTRYQDRMAIFQDQTADITAEQRTAAAEVVEEHANILMDRSRTFLAGTPA